jgi:hypothetical protein
MEFLIEPLEVGVEMDYLLDKEVLKPVRCNTGYLCSTGTTHLQPDEEG